MRDCSNRNHRFSYDYLDPDFTEQRHIDMALERAENDMTPTGKAPEKVWSKMSKYEVKNDKSKVVEEGKRKWIFSNSLLTQFRQERRLHGSNRLEKGNVLKVKPLMTSQSLDRSRVNEEVAFLRDIAIQNSNFAHVKRALSNQVSSSNRKRNISSSLQKTNKTLDCKIATIGFYDLGKAKTTRTALSFDKISSRRKTALASSRPNPCRRESIQSAPLRKTRLSFSALPRNQPQILNESSLTPSSTRCELSIRLPHVDVYEKIASSKTNEKDVKTRQNITEFKRQMVFSKCDFQNTIVSSRIPSH